MVTICFFIIFSAIVIAYGIISFKTSKEQDVILVEAGPTTCMENVRVFQHYKSPVKTIKLPDGSYKNSSEFIRIRIDGNCMQKRKICYGEEWLVEQINKSKSMQEQLNISDVLLIYIKDKNMYKIRELANFLDNEMLETIYYDGDDVKISTRPHSYSSVLGVVRYNI